MEQLALVNGCIRPGPEFSIAVSDLLIRDGRVAAVGGVADALAESPNTRVVNLQGACVLPGLIDTHFHMMATGIGLAAVDLSAASSVADVLEILRHAPSGDSEWLLARGLDESTLADHRLPYLAELDRVVPGRPLFVDDRGLHYALVNTAALRVLDATGERLAGHLDSAGSARLSERASGVARRALARAMEPAARRAALLRAARLAVSVGLTSVHAVEGGELFSDDDVELLLGMRDTLPLHVVPYWSTDDVDAAAARGLTRMGGDILCDGALGARTAALLDDYSDRPGARGEHLRDAAAVQALIEKAERVGLQVGVHAIGDRAVRGALCGLETALAGRPNSLRHRIDHFGIVWPADLEVAARIGVAVATQPAFMAMRGIPGGVYEQRLGAARVRRTYPLRDFLDAGLRVGAGSDSPVGPAAPLVGLQAALLHPVPGQSVDLASALRLYTAEAAWLGGEEQARGTLEPGKAADFVVLASDPFSVAPDRVSEIAILATYVDGVQVFGSAPPWVTGSGSQVR